MKIPPQYSRWSCSSPIYFIFILAIACVASLSGQSVTTFYVDSDLGHDVNNDGMSLSSPVLTIERARQLVALNNANMTGDITVYLRGGTYFLDETVTFTPTDSGSNGYTIRYTAFPGEQPILSGGVKLSGLTWTSNSGKFNRYSTTISDSSIPNFVDLFVGLDDESVTRAIRARYPNRVNSETLENCMVTRGAYLGMNHDTFVNADGHVSTMSDTLAIKLSDYNVVTGLAGSHMDDAELVLLQHSYHERLRLENASFDGDLAYLNFQFPEGGKFTSSRKSTAFFYDCPFFYENALGFIDTSDEWFMDIPSGGSRTLYYRIRAGEMVGSDISNYTFIVPKVNTLIQLEGTSESNMVQNMEFSGLVFKHTAWRLDGRDPNGAGLVATQAMQIRGAPWDGAKVSGAFQAQFAKEISINDNEFSQLGGSAIDFSTCVRDSRIVNNYISEVASGGITVDSDINMTSEGLQPANEETYGLVISNNVISGVGRLYTNAVAIMGNFIRDSFIENNEISYSRYMGIQTGNFISEHRDSPQGNNRIQRNYISNVMTVHDDGAGIYTLARQRQVGSSGRSTYIFENYIKDISRSASSAYDSPPATPYPVAPIYLDNYTEFSVVNNNFYQDISNAPFNVNIHEHTALYSQNNIYNDANSIDSHVAARAGLSDLYFEPLREQIFDLEPTGSPIDWSVVALTNGIIDVPGSSSLLYPGSSVPDRHLELSQAGGGVAIARLPFRGISHHGSVELKFKSNNLLNYKRLIYLHSNTGNQLAVSVGMSNGSLVVYDGSVVHTIKSGLATDTWYWVRANIDVDADTYDLYFAESEVQGRGDYGDPVRQDEPFRSVVSQIDYLDVSAASGSYSNTLAVDASKFC